MAYTRVNASTRTGCQTCHLLDHYDDQDPAGARAMRADIASDEQHRTLAQHFTEAAKTEGIPLTFSESSIRRHRSNHQEIA